MHTRKLERYTLYLRPLQLREGLRVIELTHGQLCVLATLVRNAGKIVAKETFAKANLKNPATKVTLSLTVTQLKQALGKTAAGKDFIQTIRGKGYRLASSICLAQPAAARIPVAPAGQESTGSTFKAEQFQLLVNAIEDYAIYMLDCTGRVMTWNSGAAKNKGYESAEILGQHYSVFFLPDDIEAGVPDRALILASQQGRASGEGWRIRKNGERFWASFVLTCVKSESGSIVGFAKVVRDLTERKRQEDALLRAEATVRSERDRLRAAAESSLDAFFICESVRGASGEIEDFLFTYLNANVAKMLSVPLYKLLGGKMCELLPANRALGLFDEYKRVALTGTPYVTEFPIQDQDVLSKWIHVQAVSLGDGVAITASDVTQRKQLEQQTLHLAQHDALTGVLNRSLVSERISHAIERVRPHNGCVGVCLVDIDDFKKINDSYGHLNGDMVLTTIARRLAGSLRAVDSIFRIGGDEFLVVLPDVGSEEHVALCAKRMLAAVQTPIALDSGEIRITCSIGLSAYPRTAQRVDDLLSIADAAMYSVKRRGKNGFQASSNEALPRFPR